MLRSNYTNKLSKRSFLDPSVDIALLVANPLVKYNTMKSLVSTKFHEIDIQSELNRIKKQLNKNQDSIEISVNQATKENLIVGMHKKIRILHLMCNVEMIENKVFLAL